MHHMHRMLQDNLVSRPPLYQPAQLTDPASLGIGVPDHCMTVLRPVWLPHACLSMTSGDTSSEALYMIPEQFTNTAKAQHLIICCSQYAG